jgi:hypothetical protein
VRVCARDGVIDEVPGFGVADGRRHRADEVCFDAPMPRVERGSRREGGEQVRVAQRHPQHSGLADFVGEAFRPGRDREARAQALEIPLPGPRQGLVEVVDVEDQSPFGGGEAAEIHKMRVAAQLHHHPGGGGGCEVGGHACRGTPEEAERRLRHPSVTDRQEVGHPALALHQENGHWVGPICRRRPASMAAAGHVLAQRPAGGDAVGAIDGPPVAAQRAGGFRGTSRPLERSDTCPP